VYMGGASSCFWTDDVASSALVVMMCDVLR
jgi:hypothetical protein